MGEKFIFKIERLKADLDLRFLHKPIAITCGSERAKHYGWKFHQTTYRNIFSHFTQKTAQSAFYVNLYRAVIGPSG